MLRQEGMVRMDDREALLTLAHQLGDPSKALAVSAEGNVSARLGEDTMSIKASGCSMASMTVQSRGRSNINSYDATGQHPTDEGTQDSHRSIYEASKINPQRDSVCEAILHATLYKSTEATVIAHTHPTAVNALGCSQQSQLLMEGMLFPDAIVLMGSRQLLIPYTDPGIPLARVVRAGVQEFFDSEGTAPRVIYLANHGLLFSQPPQQRLCKSLRWLTRTRPFFLELSQPADPTYRPIMSDASTVDQMSCIDAANWQPLEGVLMGEQRVALVTGASSGIGRASAAALDAAGIRLVLVARNHEKLTELASTMQGDPHIVTGDVAYPQTAREALQGALQTFGRLDILLANAGLYLPDKGWEVDQAANTIGRTNVLSVMHFVHTVLPT